MKLLTCSTAIPPHEAQKDVDCWWSLSGAFVFVIATLGMGMTSSSALAQAAVAPGVKLTAPSEPQWSELSASQKAALAQIIGQGAMVVARGFKPNEDRRLERAEPVAQGLIIRLAVPDPPSLPGFLEAAGGKNEGVQFGGARPQQ